MAVRGYSEAIFGPASTIDPAMQAVLGAGRTVRPILNEPPSNQGKPSGVCPPGFVARLVDGQYQCVPKQLFP
jgi:hypothetical protein